MTKDEILEKIQLAKSLNCKSVTVDGITFEFSDERAPTKVVELTREEILKLSAFDELSDEDVLYWSTPHYDEIQDQKELRKQQLETQDEVV